MRLGILKQKQVLGQEQAVRIEVMGENRNTVEPRLSEIKGAEPISDKQYFG
jgi:hypothetical protein